MSVGETVAVVGLALTILAGLAHVVWLVATMKSRVEILVEKSDETMRMLTTHAEACQSDRTKLRIIVEQHESRITRLEDAEA